MTTKNLVSFQSTCATTKAKLNLVPEYSSDDSDDDSLKPSEKPLFPSSSNSLPTNGQLIKSIEILTEPSAQLEIQVPNSPKKEKPSFASIITGGRSPQNETIDIKLYTGQDESDENEITSHAKENPSGTEVLSQKTFQRKRRIEFNVSSTQAKRPSQNENENTNSNAESTKDIDNSIATLNSKYSNFQKGGTEFIEKQPSSGSDDNEIELPDAVSNQIRVEQQLLEAKLNFLCQGRIDVSPVMRIQIQLQVSKMNVRMTNSMYNFVYFHKGIACCPSCRGATFGLFIRMDEKYFE